mgnify:CR=1 FL=1
MVFARYPFSETASIDKHWFQEIMKFSYVVGRGIFLLGLFLILALLGGAAATVQTVVNAQLRNWVGHPVFASFISFLVGALVLLLFILVGRLPLPPLTNLQRASWWVWIGGALGAFYIWSTIIALPRLGASVLMGAVVAGQMLISLVLDHYGLLGLERQPFNVWRALGILCLLLGVALIRGK